jgi:hypothetical protein
MAFEFDAKDSNENLHSISANKRPDTCPCCHKGIEPKFKFAFFHDNEYPTVRDNYVQAVFQCPGQDCYRIFIADYFQWNQGPREYANRLYELRHLSPYWYEKKIFPECIQKISPQFCATYNDAAAAESFKLSNVVGPGYRKALEFLVKDLLISENPSDEEEIKTAWLGNLIRDRIHDTNVKSCAERAAWLGNDETHYLRQWKDKDVGDLKTLITLAVNWIENHLLTKAYREDMKGKTKE